MRTFCDVIRYTIIFLSISSFLVRCLMGCSQGCVFVLSWVGARLGTSSPMHHCSTGFWCWVCDSVPWGDKNQSPHPLRKKWAFRWSGSRSHVYIGVTGISFNFFFLFLSKAAQWTSAKNHSTDTHRETSTSHFTSALMLSDKNTSVCNFLL